MSKANVCTHLDWGAGSWASSEERQCTLRSLVLVVLQLSTVIRTAHFIVFTDEGGCVVTEMSALL